MSTGKTYSTKYLLDSNNNRGSEGQILSTTSTGIDWVDANSVPGTGLWVTSGNSIYNSNSGNVGIGTASPAKQLVVRSSAPWIRIEEDSASNKRLDLWVDPTSAIGYIGANQSAQQLSFQTGSSDRIRILNNGNVGIGTTAPGAKLVISGGGGAISDNGFQINSSYGFNGTGVLEINPSATSHIPLSILSKNGQTANLVNVTSFGGTAGNLFNVQSSGNVGIGTDSPTARLDILTNSATGNGDIDKHIRFRADNGEQRFNFKVGQSGNAANLGMYDGDEVQKVKIDTNGDSYFNGGNVGIGTTSPVEKLHVDGKAFINGQIYGGFGALTTTGTLDWNDSTNARSGNGHTLLRGNATNGPAGAEYYHPFSWEYSSYDNDGNMTQFAIPYSTNNTGMYYRSRYNGTWTGWAEIVTTTKTLPGGPYLPLAGGTMTGTIIQNGGNIDFSDGRSANFGTGDDLQIYHSGSASYVDQAGTGKLILNTLNTGINIQAGSGETRFTKGGQNSEVKVDDATQTNKIVLKSNGNSYFNGGNVGIGTTNPQGSLHVVGPTGGQGSIYVSDKDNGEGSLDSLLITKSGTTSFIYNRDSGDLRLGANDQSSIMSINSAGNVGIGTTSPGTKLHIAETGTISPALFIDTARYGASIIGDGTSNSQYLLNLQSNGGSTDVMRVQSSGNVGIGTTSPSQKLDVNGAVNIDGTLFVNTTNNHIRLVDTDNTGNFSVGVNTNFQIRDINANTTPLTIRAGTPGNTIVTTSSGRVGIGLNSPGVTLHVDGFARLNGGLQMNATNAQIYQILDSDLRFGTNNTERMRIDNTGYVGIGTTSPSEKLHIKGSDPILLIQDDSTGTAQASSTLRLGESGAGGVLDVYWDIKQAADDLNTHLEINHSSNGNHLTILDNGNVGIGTTLPIGKFNVSKDSTTDGLSQAITVSSSSVSTKRMNLGYVPGSNYAFIDVINYAISNTNQALSLQPNGGNVGIGTTSPLSKLTIDAPIGNFANGTNAISLNYDGGSSPGDVGGGIVFSQKWWSASTGQQVTGGIFGIKHAGNGSYGGGLGFYTQPNGASNMAQHMVIRSTGEVGIGTDAPLQKLSLFAGTNESVYDVLGVYNSVTGTTAQNKGAAIRIGKDIDGNYSTKIATIYEGNNPSFLQPALAFYTMHNTYLKDSETEKMRISSNGNVGIGTTSPGYRLEVDGGIGDGVKIKAGNAASKDSLLVSTNNDVSKFLVQGDGKVIINSSTGISGRTENFQVFGKQIITNTGTDGPVLYLGYNSSGSNTIQLGRGRTADGLSYMDFNGEVMSAGQFGFRIIRYSGQNASTELNHIGTGAFKLTCTNSADIILNPNSGSVGISQTNPSHKLDVTGDGRFTSTVTATNFILSSDERLKENVEKVCDNRVEADWKTFELKTDKGQKRYGVIAQELEKTNPEFVREDSEGFKSVAYIDLLIAKIAELEARLEKLEK